MVLNIVKEHNYIWTFTGKKLYPSALSTLDIDLIDLANGLGREDRFGNQNDPHKKYSVAQHSWTIASMVPYNMKLYAMLHDGAEAYSHDMPKPIKEVMKDFKEFEDKLSSVIHLAFKLKPETPEIIKELDSRIVIDEALQTFSNPPPWAIENAKERLGIEILPVNSDMASFIWLRYMYRLLGIVVPDATVLNQLRLSW